MAHDHNHHAFAAARPSAFALGASARLGLTALAIAALWLAVAWALAG